MEQPHGLRSPMPPSPVESAWFCGGTARRRASAAALLLLQAFPQCRGNTFHGYVNPLKHYSVEKDAVFAFDLPDAETTQELQWAVTEFLENNERNRDTLAALAGKRVGHERCDTSLTTQDLWPHAQRLQAAGFELSGRYVNIGAADGVADDPLFEYARAMPARGVAVERDEAKCERHRQHLPNVEVVCTAATPHNVGPLVLSVLDNERDIDILKVDIDSYDCPVLEALLDLLSPKLVLVEVNPSIPPPYQWAMLYDPGLWPFFERRGKLSDVPIRGCSLAYEVDLLGRYGFDFIALGGHDALFTHRSVRKAWSPLLPPLDEFDCFNEAFIAANGIPVSFTRRWFFEVNDTHDGLREIWDFFVEWMRENATDIFPFALRTR